MTLLFTDVDGTLIDAAGACAAPPALLAQVAETHEIVLASSRTVEELDHLALRIGLTPPGALTAVIAEDGAIVRDRDGECLRIGQARDELLRRGADLPELRAHASAVVNIGREASLLVPVGLATDDARRRFRARGLTLSPGGRWATITADADKGSAARRLADRRQTSQWIAVGNDSNDLTLLAIASRAFVIRNAGGHHPALAAIPGVSLLEQEGSSGWIEMAARLVNRMQ